MQLPFQVRRACNRTGDEWMIHGMKFKKLIGLADFELRKFGSAIRNPEIGLNHKDTKAQNFFS
jgi:hypothetical protein